MQIRLQCKLFFFSYGHLILFTIIIISGPEKTYGSQETSIVFMHRYGIKADSSRMTNIL